jgi:hypothetical protein
MKKTTQNRVNMLTSVSGVLANHNETWKDHGAFAEGVDELTAAFPNIEEQTQLVLGSAGASEAKKLAVAALNAAVCEVMGAVASYATDQADAELRAKVAYAQSEVTKGKTGDVVARCKNIHAAATENLTALGKYGVTAAKLTALKKKIDAFDKLKVAPRDGVITRRAAGELQEQLVRSAVAILRDKLDRLVVQFKEANPTFYEEYFAARVVVDTRGNRSDNTDVQPKPTVTPALAPVSA